MSGFGKNIKKVLLCVSLVFVVYNVILFVAVGFWGHSSAFWCSYGFTVAAFAVFASVYAVNFKRGFTLEDLIFGYPVLRWSLFHITLQLAVSVVLMLVSDSRFALAFIVQLLLLCAYLGIVVLCLIGKSNAVSGQRVDEKVYYIRLLGVSLETIRNEAIDPALKTGIADLIEAVRYSDPMSHESLSTLEQEIEQQVSLLRGCVFDGDTEEAMKKINRISILVKERNGACKISKKLMKH